jgi:hypothetical protein
LASESGNAPSEAAPIQKAGCSGKRPHAAFSMKIIFLSPFCEEDMKKNIEVADIRFTGRTAGFCASRGFEGR